MLEQTGDCVVTPAPAVFGAHRGNLRFLQSPEAAATAKRRRITKQLARLELQLA